MCYSKEVSLVAGTAIILFSYRYFLTFYIQQQKQKSIRWFSQLQSSFFSTKHVDRVKEFSLWFILGFAAIGGHQFGEFASIATGNQFIYKIGLVSSILCTYFIMVAFEKLSGKTLGSKLIAFIIFIVSIDIFRTDMVFENTHFWVRGFNHKFWAFFWLANWIYLCSTIVLLGYKTKNKTNRTLYWVYALGGINISFIISWIYAIVAHRYGSSCTIINCSYHFLQDFIYSFDFPSLWCTFTFIQAPFIYIVLKKIKNSYKDDNFSTWEPNWMTQLNLIGVTIVFISIWYVFTPMLLGVSWKMMSK